MAPATWCNQGIGLFWQTIRSVDQHKHSSCSLLYLIVLFFCGRHAKDCLNSCNHIICQFMAKITEKHPVPQDSSLGVKSCSCSSGDLLNLSSCVFSCRCGGTVGAILTCPLEVVKTRLQSSSITLYVSEVQLNTVNAASVARVSPPGPLHCLK